MSAFLFILTITSLLNFAASVKSEHQAWGIASILCFLAYIHNDLSDRLKKMKNGSHILKTKEESNFRTGHSTFIVDHSFGYRWAKTDYRERKPIEVLEKRSSAHLGRGFADFIYRCFKERKKGLVYGRV